MNAYEHVAAINADLAEFGLMVDIEKPRMPLLDLYKSQDALGIVWHPVMENGECWAGETQKCFRLDADPIEIREWAIAHGVIAA